MKFSFLILALSLAACGEMPKAGRKVGEIKSFSPVTVEGNDSLRIAGICQGISQKTQHLEQVQGTSLSFEVNQTNCSKSPIDSGSVDVRIQKESAQRFVFKRTLDGLDFVFPEVETTSSGLLGQICAGMSDLKSPLKLSNGNALWYSTTEVSSADCSATANETCIVLDIASPLEDGTFKVHTREWIRFRVSPTLEKNGFYSYRKLVSSAFCSVNQTREIKATLK